MPRELGGVLQGGGTTAEAVGSRSWSWGREGTAPHVGSQPWWSP